MPMMKATPFGHPEMLVSMSPLLEIKTVLPAAPFLSDMANKVTMMAANVRQLRSKLAFEMLGSSCSKLARTSVVTLSNWYARNTIQRWVSNRASSSEMVAQTPVAKESDAEAPVATAEK